MHPRPSSWLSQHLPLPAPSTPLPKSPGEWQGALAPTLLTPGTSLNIHLSSCRPIGHLAPFSTRVTVVCHEPTLVTAPSYGPTSVGLASQHTVSLHEESDELTKRK